tara:strand:+ start:160 stop:360 length:201 start_codon:yes stop_codon:yes gene_type:complete
MIKKADKNLSSSKIKNEILSLKKSLINLYFQKSSGQLEKTSQIKKTKKNIAKLKMQINQLSEEKNA